jgi:CBS domain-containing protein
MNLGEICSTEIAFIDSEATLQQAAAAMRERHVGSLVVTEASRDGAEVLGFVTDRDLVVEGMARGVDAARTAVGRLASPGVAALPASAGLGQAIAYMKERGVRRLLVAAEGDRLHGIVSADDIVAALGHEMAGLAHALRKGIARETSERPPVAPADAARPRLRAPLTSYC